MSNFTIEQLEAILVENLKKAIDPLQKSDTYFMSSSRHVPTSDNFISLFVPLHEKFLQFDWLRAVVFQHNLKYVHVKITNLLREVV